MKIDALMTRAVVTCRPDDSLNGAAQRMWDHDCGALAVVDGEGHLAGMLTDRDICMAGYFRGQALQHLRVADAMSREVHSLPADQSVKAALQAMEQHKVRRLPVVDAQGRLVGILSLADLVRASGRKGASGKLKPEHVLDTLRAICAAPAPEPEVLVVEVRPAPRQKPAEAAKRPEGKRKAAKSR